MDFYLLKDPPESENTGDESIVKNTAKLMKYLNFMPIIVTVY